MKPVLSPRFRTFLVAFFVLTGSLLGVHAQTVSFATREANMPCLDKTFTVVAHQFLDSINQEPVISEAEIRELFEEVSALFFPICVRFEVCAFEYSPLFSFDTLYSEAWLLDMTTRFAVDNHIQVYFLGRDQAPEGQLCGRASFEGIREPEGSYIVVERECLTRFSLARHLGRYFGLYATNNGDVLDELVDGSNCETTGDFICDTPPDPFGKAPTSPYFDAQQPCLFILDYTDVNGEHYQPDMGNIMSEYIDCHCGFSRGQYLKMAENYLSSLRKKW